MKTPAGSCAIVLLAFVGVVAVARIGERPVGALVIDVADAARRELVWRGIGVNAIDIDAKPEKRGDHRQDGRDNPDELPAQSARLIA
jgi:hypothetical protein